jgi:stage V sporulation protein AF
MSKEESNVRMYMSGNFPKDMQYLKDTLAIGSNYDIVYRVINIGGRNASMYFIDGFCKDELMQKLLQQFMDLTEETMPENAHEMSKSCVSYVEVDIQKQWDKIINALLSGVFVLLVEGYDEALLIDARTYPARNVDEPDKDKVLRGSKDGFVETLVFNTALIRRRIRSTDLRMEILCAGENSKTDIVVSYMDSRVDHTFLEKLKSRIQNIQVDSLTMNQESLAECIYQRKWYNPFPKFKYTERPDTASAQILEGNIVVLVDNSPSAMIMPTTIFDMVEEADDYNFPPLTGTYLRLTRTLIALLTYFVTPTYLLLSAHTEWIPDAFGFIILKESPNIPLIWQFLILELAIDGLRLAAVNTPSMLSTPLSVMAALVLGEFSVESGWFSSEVLLYMAFVAIANYTQANYELGYALKFMRILNLIFTQLFGLTGYIAAVIIAVFAVVRNRTVAGTSYIYPLFPFNAGKLKSRLIRRRLPGSFENSDKSF